MTTAICHACEREFPTQKLYPAIALIPPSGGAPLGDTIDTLVCAECGVCAICALGAPTMVDDDGYLVHLDCE